MAVVMLIRVRCTLSGPGSSRVPLQPSKKLIMATANNTADARNVFLVDDGSSLVNLYSRRLEQAGFKTTSAFDTQEVCEALPNAFAPVPGGWGRMGYTTVSLRAVSEADLTSALGEAHGRASEPKKKPKTRPAPQR